MATLISPGVSVTITDESFFIPASAPTVPLFFIATADEKTQPGSDQLPAAGTYEHDTVRVVTSLKQSVELYGVPRFLTDSAGNPHHGDARNEYGLFALNQFLGVGSKAYVVRANVNLDDDLTSLRNMWDRKITDAVVTLEGLATAFINDYNSSHSYVPSTPGTNGSQAFQFNPPIDGTEPHGITATQSIDLVVDGTPVTLSFDPSDPLNSGYVTTQGLVSWFNSAAAGVAQAQLVQATVTSDAKIVIISATQGSTSSVLITNDTIFSSLTGFDVILPAVAGTDSPYKRTVTRSELFSLINQAMDPVFTSYSFADNKNNTIPVPTINVRSDLMGDHTTAPYLMYPNGYDNPAVPSSPDGFIGVTGEADYWIANAAGSVNPTEWTPAEAGDLLQSAADDYKFTVEFWDKTKLGDYSSSSSTTTSNDAARRVAIKTALQATINSNTEVRSDSFEYNLVLCPGWPEVVDELLALVNDIEGPQEEVFIIADCPMDRSPERITSPATGWAASTERVGSVHVAYYYPSALASNLDGREVCVAASGVALRTYAYSDNVADLWWAPAGLRRGQITGISQLGYVSGTLGGPTTFTEVNLNMGQRNDLYQYAASGDINPLVFFPGKGFFVWGQKTSTSTASAMDRVNVSRLMKYIKRSLRKNTLSFVFEPNDQITRDSLKAVVDAFLGELITKRGLYDFITVCDESNNSADRIDRNEMYIDIAVKPVKAAEFIYIPIRIVSTGTKLTGN